MHKVFYCCCQSIFNVQSIFWGLRLVSGLFKISYLHSYDSWGQSLKYFILIVHKSCLIFWWQLPTSSTPYEDRRVSYWEACLVGQQVFRGRALGGGLKGWCWVSVGLRSTGAGVWNCVSRVDVWSILIGPERKFQFFCSFNTPLVVAM